MPTSVVSCSRSSRAADASPDCAGPRHQSVRGVLSPILVLDPLVRIDRGPGNWSETSVAADRLEVRLAPKHLKAAPRVLGASGAKLLRPFARRRASTRRPPFEAMRARKPCSRFRARFLGW
jgi:hypothetical protein